jgi:hypothetical protein
MASKKKGPKKGSEKRKGKKGKALKKRAAAKQPAGKKPKKGKKKGPSPEALVGKVDLATVMITQGQRKRICREAGFTARETGYVTKVITSIHLAISHLQAVPIGDSDNPLLPATIGEGRAVDLATLIKVATFPDLQDEVRLATGQRGSFIGPVSTRLLMAFVRKAQKVVLADASTG